MTKWRKIHDKMEKEGAPFNLKQLKVKGDELILAGVQKDRAGEILNALLYDCAIEPKLNEKQTLINRALNIYQKQ